MSGNGKIIPLALRLENPSDPVNAFVALDQLIADQHGALWQALADPIGGLALETVFGAGALSVDGPQRILGTAAAMYVWDEAGSGLIQQVNRGDLDADGLSDVRMAALTAAALQAFNPVNGSYDRLRCFAAGEDVTSPESDAGWLATNAALMLKNAAGTSVNGMLSANTAVDTIAASSSNWLRTAGVGYAFNGGTFDRLGTASSANLAAQTGSRAQLAAAPGEWPLVNAPAADTVATATRAAGGSNVRHVLRSINATLVGVAAIAAPIIVVVRDGASGVGGIIWADQLFAPSAGSIDRVSISGLNLVGSANTAMTVEFVAAPGATNFEALSATGYSATAAAA